MPRSASGARHGYAGACRRVGRAGRRAPARLAARRRRRPGARDVRRRRRARLGDDLRRAPGRGRHVTRPWPPGSATGIGSLPGTEIAEALRLAFDELPDLPHLPELPARGAGADMIGRGATLLAELPVEIQPSAWRLTARP